MKYYHSCLDNYTMFYVVADIHRKFYTPTGTCPVIQKVYQKFTSNTSQMTMHICLICCGYIHKKNNNNNNKQTKPKKVKEKTNAQTKHTQTRQKETKSEINNHTQTKQKEHSKK